ncbi:tRNA-splicing endonuclease subunit Sen34 isoform X2 [Manduca sexta]|uniref:tRNA-splicing endonuclease subunit Sen34 n=1 Tax=Manduca sexta TaxID=7130 RepID=A0A921ZKZ6_MANSE|nr:tRNA-splicing endonuclease subunit Sen34 isoform X2 [Manduca sexta]KAG6459446.1 hypothetical protein O3G_MSEX011389 [Manduca sexta]KAG6459447.1 hypothetical protein O3G_MSEX011389 [Manduca sexta]KAG6459448.1 hypothetical protein O3G_MSEX011389 [Manduca sexta]
MIPLYVINGIAYVWNSDDWYVLRTRHRICGALIGSAPSFPRQNDFLGLPMALLSEEATLLVEKGFCELYELPNVTRKPSKEEKEIVKSLEDKVLLEQIQELKRRKIEQLSQKIDIIVAGKKEKLLSKGITDTSILNKQVLLEEEINKMPKLAPIHALVHLPTEHNLSTEKKKVDINVLEHSPQGENNIKYLIFKNLWEKGFYITDGSKFGSDYLLYPGDPVKFHATYMVRCICDKDTTFLPTNMVTFGRLSVAVNKLAVLAYCNPFGSIEYQTLQWHDSVTL